MRGKEIIRNIGLATVLTAVGTPVLPMAEGNASAATVKNYECNPVADKWYPLNQGEIVIVKASGAVIPADETVDGFIQYDNDENTATVIGLKSKDNTDKTWIINNDYQGSILVKKCGATNTSTYTSLGREAAVLDKRLGVNNPIKRVNLNWVEK